MKCEHCGIHLSVKNMPLHEETHGTLDDERESKLLGHIEDLELQVCRLKSRLAASADASLDKAARTFAAAPSNMPINDNEATVMSSFKAGAAWQASATTDITADLEIARHALDRIDKWTIRPEDCEFDKDFGSSGHRQYIIDRAKEGLEALARISAQYDDRDKEMK